MRQGRTPVRVRPSVLRGGAASPRPMCSVEWLVWALETSAGVEASIVVVCPVGDSAEVAAFEAVVREADLVAAERAASEAVVSAQVVEDLAAVVSAEAVEDLAAVVSAEAVEDLAAVVAVAAAVAVGVDAGAEDRTADTNPVPSNLD
ncbi:MAG: hypothetical protein AAGU11_05690 [Syntrophobacteraceae bacterium]